MKGFIASTSQRTWVAKVVLLLTIACVLPFGFMYFSNTDPDKRFVESHYRSYRLKKFLHLTERDYPLLHRTVGLAFGKHWNRRFCGEAYRERQTYEKRMTKRQFLLRKQSALSDEFKARWAQLDLDGYCRYSVRRNGMLLEVLGLESDIAAVEGLLADYDRLPE